MSDIFYQIDANGDGAISLDEVIDIYIREFRCEPSQQQKIQLYEHFAGLKTDKIEFSDFIVHAINEQTLQTSDRLATAFRYFDTDGSGSISPDELVEGLNFDASRGMDEEVAKAIMNQIQVDLEELTFKNFILLINHYKHNPPIISASPEQAKQANSQQKFNM